MKKLIRYLGFSLSLFSATTWAEVVQVEYQDIKGAPAAKYASPYYINPQSTFSAAVTAGVGRHILLEVKNTKGDLVFTQSKNRVQNQDTFVVNGVTYFGAKFDVTKLADGQYTLTSVVSDGEIEVSRQNNELIVDTKTPAILGDFYWQHFGNYTYKHSDNKYIISPVHGSDAGFPGIDPGASGFSHGTFSSEFLDGPKAGTFHAQNLPLLLTDQGKIIIGNGNLHTITTAHIPDNTANQMRLTYTIFNKVGASSSRSVDVYVATRKAPRPEPYGIFTGVSSQLDNKPVFTGFVPYVPGMTIPNNPVRMLYRAPKEFYLGGGGNAEIYGSWLNGSRRANRVVHTDDQFVYFDLTGSTDGKQYGSLQHYTRDLSTWRNHFFIHDLVAPSNMAPPKSTGFSFFVQGKNQWLNSNVSHHITKFDTNGATDSISKIRVQVEPRAYEQRFSYDFRNTGNINRFGNCIIPASDTECTIDTSLPFPGDDLHQYHNRHMITNLTNTLFSPEIVSSWLYDGSIAELDPASIVNDIVNKTITFSVIDKFKDRANASSTVRVMDAFAVNHIGVKRKLTRTKYDSTPLTSSNQLFTATYSYSGLPDGTYSLEGYVEDGFSGVAMRNKSTHVLFAGIAIDTTPPKISTNILGGAIKALRSIEIKVLDNSESSITSAILTGGKDNVNISLPIVKIASKNFRPEHIYIAPSETLPYTLTVKAMDTFGNASTHVEKFLYVPVVIKLPDIKQPAISSPLKSASGMPSNVIQTPQVKNPLGELAQGNHEAIFTVLPTATSGMIINGQLISPGETKHFTVNLSQTNHRLTFEAYPAVSGQALTNQFEINLPDVRVSLCPATFELNSEQCILVKFTNPDLKCSSPYALNNASCELKIAYEPAAECLTGYTLSGTVCKGTYSVAPIKKCPNDFSWVNDGTCNQVQTKPLKVCADDEVAEESFCKTSSGTTVPQKAYCEGVDVSGGSFCDGGKCYTYKPDWNACQITIQAPTSDICQVGTYTSGTCQVSDEYTLNMQCPFGFNRDGILCKRIEIIDPIKSCENGFTLIGSTCAKTEVAPYTSCPSTHHLVEGRCHVTSATTINCPANYTWDGQVCRKLETEPATPICPNEYTFNGTLCQKDEIVDATLVCPIDFVPDGTKCSNKKTRDATPICPENHSWSTANEVCEKPEELPSTSTCLPGFNLDANICQKPEQIPAIESCSPSDIASGYTWNGTACVKPDYQNAEINCAPDHTWNGNACEKINIQAANLTCPAGYALLNGACTMTQSTTASRTCPAGQSLVGSSCRSTETIAADVSCPSGYYYESGSCHFTETYSPEYSCSGFMSNNNPGMCVVDVYGDMGSFLPCNSPYVGTSGGRCAIYDWPTPECNYGGWFSGGMCRISHEAAANFYCPSGYSLSGTNCSRTVSTTAGYSCPASGGWTLDSTMCTRTLTQPHFYTCPAGWLVDGSQCKQSSILQATYSCPVTGGWALVDNMCERYFTQTTFYSCPNSQGWNLDDTVCNRIVTQPTIPTCPSTGGWTLNGLMCNRIVSLPPESYMCLPNEILEGSICSTITIQEPDSYQCSPGWVNELDKCRLTTTKPITRYECQKDWTLDGTLCRIVLNEPETRTCSATHTKIDSLRCYLNIPATNVGECQEGWTSNLTHCTLAVSKPADLSCLPTHQLIASQCHTTIEQPVTVECQPDEVFEGGKCVMIRNHSPIPLCPTPYLLENPTSCKNEIVIPKFK